MTQSRRIILFRGYTNHITLGKCRACKRKLIVGKNIVSKISSANRRVHYHIKCAKKKNII